MNNQQSHEIVAFAVKAARMTEELLKEYEQREKLILQKQKIEDEKNRLELERIQHAAGFLFLVWL